MPGWTADTEMGSRKDGEDEEGERRLLRTSCMNVRADLGAAASESVEDEELALDPPARKSSLYPSHTCASSTFNHPTSQSLAVSMSYPTASGIRAKVARVGPEPAFSSDELSGGRGGDLARDGARDERESERSDEALRVAAGLLVSCGKERPAASSLRDPADASPCPPAA